MSAICQCLTKNGQGPQCKRNAVSGKRFCFQHNNCTNFISGRVSNIERENIHASVSVPKQQQVPRSRKMIDDVQHHEVTFHQTRQRIADCDICGKYVKVREMLQPLDTYPSYLQNRDHIVSVCTDCYNDCLGKCVNVMGKPYETDCKTKICGDYYKAKEYARIDQQRINKDINWKLSGVAAVQTKLGMGTKLWPSVPKNDPK